MKLTYKTRLLVTDERRSAILDMLKAERNAWNACSKIQFGLPKRSIKDLHAKFYLEYRHATMVPSQVIIIAQRSVLAAYNSIKSNKHKIDKPAVKKRLSAKLDKRSYSYKDDTLSIISLGKRVKCKFYRYPKLDEYLQRYKFCDPTIYEQNGELWISLTFDLPEVLPQSDLAVGIDLGCRVYAATSEGNLYIDKRYNKHKRRLRYLKRCLNSKKDTGSKSARRHLRKLRRKEHNRSKDLLHNLSSKIIKDTKADVIVLENLKSLKVKKNKYKNNNRISQVPFAELKRILTYKALLHGKQVITVSPAYSSQIDSLTGKKDGIRCGRRYIAKSGRVYDADWNAAINIAKFSHHPVSFSEPFGQATANSPIVGSGLQATSL